jgi:hypothetical protein
VAVPTTPSHVEGLCPSDEWEEYGAHCFYFSHPDDYTPGTTRSWLAAWEHCQTIGHGFQGDLVSVHNRQMNDWIYDKLNVGSSYYQDGYWIGLRRHDVGKWAVMMPGDMVPGDMVQGDMVPGDMEPGDMVQGGMHRFL